MLLWLKTTEKSRILWKVDSQAEQQTICDQPHLSCQTSFCLEGAEATVPSVTSPSSIIFSKNNNNIIIKSNADADNASSLREIVKENLREGARKVVGQSLKGLFETF